MTTICCTECGCDMGNGHHRLCRYYSPPTLRPSVQDFASRMETVLRLHDEKKGGQKNWRQDDPWSLLKRLRQEVNELAKELDNPPRLRNAARESIDVANFAMMICDLCAPLRQDKEPT